MSEERTTISFRTDEATRDKLDEVAKAFDRDRSYIVKEAVAEYLTHYDWQLERIKKGIEAADRGDFATDEEVEAVFRKYTDVDAED